MNNNNIRLFLQTIAFSLLTLWAANGSVAQTTLTTVRPVIADIALSPTLSALRPLDVTRSCPTSALIADVVAIDHPMVFNRLPLAQQTRTNFSA